MLRIVSLVHAHPGNLVLLVNNSSFENIGIKNALKEAGIRHVSSAAGPSITTAAGPSTADPSTAADPSMEVVVASRNQNHGVEIDAEMFREIDAETNAKDRAALYLKGGVLAVTR